MLDFLKVDLKCSYENNDVIYDLYDWMIIIGENDIRWLTKILDRKASKDFLCK